MTVHTCWDMPDFDGTVDPNCEGCLVAVASPCDWCGYGHMFPTHNPIAHFENGQPNVPMEDDWTDEMLNGPTMSKEVRV